MLIGIYFTIGYTVHPPCNRGEQFERRSGQVLLSRSGFRPIARTKVSWAGEMVRVDDREDMSKLRDSAYFRRTKTPSCVDA